ncbi:MAG: hypothetical protein ACRBHB_15910 [Arenicella sp.]
MHNKAIKKEEYTIIEKFEITGRGVVVVIDECTERVPGKAYNVMISADDSQNISAEAFKEWFLRRNPKPVEKEAYMLKGLHKKDIPDDAKILFF